MDLELATIENMAAELERRKLAFALVVSHVRYWSEINADPEIPPEFVLADSFGQQHPAFKAAFLCDGIQRCLEQALATGSDAAAVAHLSARMNDMKATLETLLPKSERLGPDPDGPPAASDRPDAADAN